MNKNRKQIAASKMLFALQLVQTAYYKDDKFDLTFSKLWPGRADVINEAIDAAAAAGIKAVP